MEKRKLIVWMIGASVLILLLSGMYIWNSVSSGYEVKDYLIEGGIKYLSILEVRIFNLIAVMPIIISILLFMNIGIISRATQ